MPRSHLSTKNAIDRELIRKLQDRIAELAIGNSTLRNQGAKGVPRKARELLKTIRLDRYSKCRSQQDFSEKLDSDTDRIKERLPRGARHRGTARKALNIFLRNVLYNVYLCRHFHLSGIVSWLELPLDSYSMDGLRAEKEGAELPKHPTIKHMDETLNAKFQDVARKVADRKGTQAVHLDLLYWRGTKKKLKKHSRRRTGRKRVLHR